VRSHKLHNTFFQNSEIMTVFLMILKSNHLEKIRCNRGMSSPMLRRSHETLSRKSSTGYFYGAAAER